MPYSTHLFARIACATLAVSAIAGCEVFKHNEEAMTVINRRAVGMPVGEFFDRFGRPGKRVELPDGSAIYDWISSVPEASRVRKGATTASAGSRCRSTCVAASAGWKSCSTPRA